MNEGAVKPREPMWGTSSEIKYDAMSGNGLACIEKLTDSQINLPQEIKRKFKRQ